MAQDNLNSAQRRVINALLVTRTATEAAEVAGVAPRTLRRWLADPTFRAALTDAESELIDATMRQLLTLQEQVIATLAAALTDRNMNIRLKAAGMILDNSLKLRELVSFEQRLSALEAAHGTENL